MEMWDETRQITIPVRLQWGHDISVMEMSIRCSNSPSLSMLQWGHDISVMEIEIDDEEFDLVSALQWGHDISVMEI